MATEERKKKNLNLILFFSLIFHSRNLFRMHDCTRSSKTWHKSHHSCNAYSVGNVTFLLIRNLFLVQKAVFLFKKKINNYRPGLLEIRVTALVKYRYFKSNEENKKPNKEFHNGSKLWYNNSLVPKSSSLTKVRCTS